MKHIGEVLRALSIPSNINTVAISIEPESVKCPICHDAGFLRADVPIEHPNFGKLIACVCTEKRRRDQSRLNQMTSSNLRSMSDKTFENFDGSLDGVEEALDAAIAFTDGSSGKPWLFLHGTCGSGKTHLAAAIGNIMMQQNSVVLFTVVPDLLDHLRATFDPQNGIGYDEMFQNIRDVEVLILDDIGTENATPWAREKLFQVINHRYNHQLPTVFTSNQDFKNNRRLIDERVLSRLMDTRLSEFVHLDAEDFRLRRIGRPNTAPRR